MSVPAGPAAASGLTGLNALTALAILHLAINLVHGRAHSLAHVDLSPAGLIFVLVVIIAGPIVGVVVARWRPALGGWLTAASMAGALIFGLVNHFIIQGADHVSQVDARWQSLFAVTAALLVAIEAVGVVIAARYATRPVRRTS